MMRDEKYINADELLQMLPDDLPYKASVKRVLIQAPAANVVEVKQGNWIPVQYTYFGLKRYECSECSDDEYWQKRYLEHKEKYCPNCGARMDGDN